MRRTTCEAVLVSDEYITSGGTMSADRFAEFQKAQTHVNKVNLAKDNFERESKRTGRICPFSNKSDNGCSKECALYRDGCTLARQERGGGETVGRPCPFIFSHKCTELCALYDNGCRMSAI